MPPRANVRVPSRVYHHVRPAPRLPAPPSHVDVWYARGVPGPIDNAVVLITGASSGIGRELARLIAPRAKAVVLAARRADRLERLAEELRKARADLSVLAIACDIADRAAADRMLAQIEAELGPLDVLVNSAGLGDLGVFDLSDADKQQQMIELNVKSLVYLTRRVLPSMVAKRRGGVLNISSGFGLTFGPGMATYVGTKHFVTGFTESLRVDLAGTGVVVTQVCPGPVATEFEANVGNFTGMHPPKLIEISAASCARAAIRAFDRRAALTIPGFWIKLLMGLGAMTPRFILRLVYGRAARLLRKKQLSLG
jgi:short-subunit dehydrogenase